jgi:hypothetical protein
MGHSPMGYVGHISVAYKRGCCILRIILGDPGRSWEGGAYRIEPRSLPDRTQEPTEFAAAVPQTSPIKRNSYITYPLHCLSYKPHPILSPSADTPCAGGKPPAANP